MPLSILFWVVYIVALLFSLWASYDGQPNWPRRVGGSIVIWVLVGILGWSVFGAAVK